jgi:hypothetical protein
MFKKIKQILFVRNPEDVDIFSWARICFAALFLSQLISSVVVFKYPNIMSPPNDNIVYYLNGFNRNSTVYVFFFVCYLLYSDNVIHHWILRKPGRRTLDFLGFILFVISINFSMFNSFSAIISGQGLTELERMRHFVDQSVIGIRYAVSINVVISFILLLISFKYVFLDRTKIVAYFGDGSHYKGEMREGVAYGHGLFVEKDGKRYEGKWSNGVHVSSKGSKELYEDYVTLPKEIEKSSE